MDKRRCCVVLACSPALACTRASGEEAERISVGGSGVMDGVGRVVLTSTSPGHTVVTSLLSTRPTAEANHRQPAPLVGWVPRPAP